MPDIKELRINGKTVRVNADRDRPLLGVLRDDLGLTGSKYGCGEGRCGACTVLIDGEPVAVVHHQLGAVAAREITTIEGLERDGKLHPLQQAFLDAGAMQCGYCTSGMIMAGVALLHQNPDPSRRRSSSTWTAISAGAEPIPGSSPRSAGPRKREGGQPMNERTVRCPRSIPTSILSPRRYELR